MRMRRTPIALRAFTLIELLVVMSIVALLLSIAVPRYFGSLERSKDVTLQQNLRVLRDTLDKFYADKGRYPQSLDELVTQKYLRAVPVDPMTESATTWIELPAADASQKGIGNVISGAQGKTQNGIPYEKL